LHVSFFLLCRGVDLNNLNAARTSAAGEGWTEPNHNFLSAVAERKCKQVPPRPLEKRSAASLFFAISILS